MLRLHLLLLALALAPAFAQPLSQSERDRAMSELHATRKIFLDSLAGLSEAQWKFKPDANTWSIAECAEHIALTEDALFELVTNQILHSPAAPEKKAEVKDKDERVLKVIADRSHKAKAPERLVPTHRWSTEQALIEHFKQSRDHTIAYVQTTQDDLRSHFLAHPAVGELDAYQWLLLAAAHTQRHTAQINEVKGLPNYPGGR